MKLSNITAIFIGLILFVILMGSNYVIPLTAPDNAIVYTDAGKKIYYAPPYIDIAKPPTVDAKKLGNMTLKEAKSQNYSPDEASVEKGYFRQEYRPLSTYLLEKMGLLKPLPIRWNSDGAWSW